MKRILLLCLVGSVFAGLMGCTGTQTFSHTARSGDTVVVAIGRTNGAQYIDSQGLTATLVVNGVDPYPVRVREVVRVYADPTSDAALGPVLFGSQAYPSYAGQWMAIVDLVDPSTNNPYPSMSTGSAVLDMEHTSISGLHDPDLTIISGTGSIHQLFSTLGSVRGAYFLQSDPYVSVETSGAPSVAVAGATFVIRFDSSNIAEPDSIRPTKLSQDPNVQLLFARSDLGGGLYEFKVVVLNPHGFDAVVRDEIIAGRSRFEDLAFLLTWVNDLTPLPSTGLDITLESVEYIDINGDVITSELTADFAGGHGYTQN